MQILARRGVASYTALLRDILANDMVAGARILTRLQDLYDTDDAFRRDLIAELNHRNALQLRSLPRHGTDAENAMPSAIAVAVGATSIPAQALTNNAGEGDASELPAANTEQFDEDNGLRWAALLAAADSLQTCEDGLPGPSRG
jgi:hypothetical protein